jgi:hypothetical protein
VDAVQKEDGNRLRRFNDQTSSLMQILTEVSKLSGSLDNQLLAPLSVTLAQSKSTPPLA